MTELSSYLVSPVATVLDAMSVIDTAAKGVAFVCSDKKILGVITDGDIRRYIIRGGDLSCNVMDVANRNFKFLRESDSVDAGVIKKIRSDYKALPVLDAEGRILSIIFEDDTASLPPANLHIPVVIMAGGKGTRLYPYTKVLPKPLIPIGDVPITMHIMQHFEKYGCTRFTMVVNHQKELIKAYYSDPDLPYDIDFADEKEPLGTAGGLKLLEGKISGTFFMTNCDILIDASYDKIYQYHKKMQNLVTMVCAVKKITIPYGTVYMNDAGRIENMVEKPTLSYLVNTGYYVVESEFISEIPNDTFIHMTDVVQKCIDAGKPVGVYPISEGQWSDMGQIDEMERMRDKLIGGRDG
ncbi:MAG: nucleotidyltransferase family protein [Methanocorpusculum sp.]|uniref:nucleotidyltransferase family protein n=1 Tax=Methanocorpusculum sp. TaxID=2058474 RepID=UPI002728D7B7|nr:nucleotidyltransferase family protein [Methanocorpusculum sp.]MDO9523808.1 nucleotidyltransferase family protein [Methanocorpusculum sp.]